MGPYYCDNQLRSLMINPDSKTPYSDATQVILFFLQILKIILSVRFI